MVEGLGEEESAGDGTNGRAANTMNVSNTTGNPLVSLRATVILGLV